MLIFLLMESIHTLSLPIVREENVCLPLVINAVSKYWGVDLPLTEAIEIAKKYPGAKGSILIEGVELAERHGLSSVILNSSLRELREMIDMGIPLIVILPGLKDVVQHASLVVGYDEMERTIFHYIPEPNKILQAKHRTQSLMLSGIQGTRQLLPKDERLSKRREVLHNCNRHKSAKICCHIQESWHSKT